MGKVKLAAIADIHCNKDNRDYLHGLFEQMAGVGDIILLCGDLTDAGHLQEAEILADILRLSRVPIVGVLGNHDHESGKHDEIKQILCDAGVTLLDGDIFKAKGLGFAGVKGFCGGFGGHQLQAWGERVLKSFVQEAIDEELKLEAALVKIDDVPRIVLSHYSPIRKTVEGESLEIFPFMGTSRLEQPIDRYGVVAVFHGHAHHGSPQGVTTSNIPVYNVSAPVFAKIKSDQAFRVVEVSGKD